MAETAYTRPEETFGPTVMRFLRARALSTVALEQGVQRATLTRQRGRTLTELRDGEVEGCCLSKLFCGSR
jgi:hypothetical protein